MEAKLGSHQVVLPSDAQVTDKFRLKGWAKDADGEDVRICLHCKLPLGDCSQLWRGDYVHGECLAQLVMQDTRSEEDERIQRKAEKKRRQHSEYGIGWMPEHIPCNSPAASKLAMRDVSPGLI